MTLWNGFQKVSEDMSKAATPLFLLLCYSPDSRQPSGRNYVQFIFSITNQRYN